MTEDFGDCGTLLFEELWWLCNWFRHYLQTLLSLQY